MKKNWDFEITDDLIKSTIEFHTKPSPGTYVGIYLLKYLVENLGEVEGKLHVISETSGCFADVVQHILHRTVGNRYLRLQKLGNVAYTAYGREDDENALRVYVDLKKIDKEKYPYLYGFFTGTRPHHKYERKVINGYTIKEFLQVKSEIFSMEKVKITGIKYKKDRKKIILCDKCGQSFTSWDFDQKTCFICKSNKDELYYTKK